MYLWRKVLLFSFNLLRQRHDISVLLFIVHGHALWRGRMSEFGPIRNHYHVHLVDHSARAGCSTFCCATPCWREPTSSKQLSTVAAFCWFSVWSLSCQCHVAVVLSFLRSPALQKFESKICRPRGMPGCFRGIPPVAYRRICNGFLALWLAVFSKETSFSIG